MSKITLEIAEGRVIYVRSHTGRIPGPYSLAFAIEEVEPGVWEAKIAMDAMPPEERRDFTRAVEEHGGICRIKWVRYPERGEPYERETKFNCGCGNAQSA